MTSRRLQPLGIIVVCLTLALPAAAQESVTFTQLLPPPEAGPVSLTGALYKPTGPGPYAALVIIHGCSGILAAYLEWAEFLRDHGYVSLVVDNFGPRGVREACTGQSQRTCRSWSGCVMPTERWRT